MIKIDNIKGKERKNEIFTRRKDSKSGEGQFPVPHGAGRNDLP